MRTEVSTARDTVNCAEWLVAQALDTVGTGDIVITLGGALGQQFASGELTLYAEPEAQRDLAQRLSVVLQHFKERVWRSQYVTTGAKDLVASAVQIEPAFRVLVTDKAARAVLRSDFELDIQLVVDSGTQSVRVPSMVVRPDRLVHPSEPGADVEDPAMAHSFGAACRAHGVAFRILERSPVRIAYRAKGVAKSVQLTDLVGFLGQPSKRGQVNDVCQGLLGSNGDRFLLIVLYAAMQAGALDVHPSIEPQFRVFCIRALLAMNAAESAWREALSLSDDAAALTKLSSGELRRLDALLARAATRSGRIDEAGELFMQLYSQDLGDAAGYRELLGSVFSRGPGLGRALCEVAVSGDLELRPQDVLFVADVLRGYGEPHLAFSLLQRLGSGQPEYGDTFIGLANVGLALGSDSLWRSAIVHYFQIHGLPVMYVAGDELRPFRFVAADPYATADHPLVTIVMTTFDAAETLALAVASVQAQSFTNWELIIVDDVSTDATREEIARLVESDGRVSSIMKTQNEGTYLAKNEGIRRAQGEFVTFHDSDDWMHPMRLERHIDAMSGGAACSISRWIRMDAEGLAIVRRGGPFTHLNPASTFFRRAALETIGFFHGVRTGADAEILARVRASLGWGSVLEIDESLGIGLHHEKSLTQSGPAAFDEFRYSPVRLAYTEAWLRRHVTRIADGASLYDDGSGDLDFAVPDAIRARGGPA